MQSLNKKTKNKRRRIVLGLSALELLIILAAITIVIMISAPGATILLEKYRLKETEKSLLSGLELARMEAQLRSSVVVVCPSSNGHSCRRDNDWNYGWVVFSDGNGNGTVQDIELIKSFVAPNQRIRIEATGATTSRAAFTTTGLLSDHDALTGQFRICMDDSSAAPRLIEIHTDGWVTPILSNDESCETG